MTGRCTNNQAEYIGLIHGMAAALKAGVKNITVFGDSELVIRQMTGVYKVKQPIMQKMHAKATMLRTQFLTARFEWLPRESNAVADGLSKVAMKQPAIASEAADWFDPTAVK
jgi:ribonuclease HI